MFKNFLQHEDYVKNPDNYLNDIALITLANPVELNDYVQLACLPNIVYGSYPPINSSAIAVGRVSAWTFLVHK